MPCKINRSHTSGIGQGASPEIIEAPDITMTTEVELTTRDLGNILGADRLEITGHTPETGAGIPAGVEIIMTRGETEHNPHELELTTRMAISPLTATEIRAIIGTDLHTETIDMIVLIIDTKVAEIGPDRPTEEGVLHQDQMETTETIIETTEDVSIVINQAISSENVQLWKKKYLENTINKSRIFIKVGF